MGHGNRLGGKYTQSKKRVGGESRLMRDMYANFCEMGICSHPSLANSIFADVVKCDQSRTMSRLLYIGCGPTCNLKRGKKGWRGGGEREFRCDS